MSWANYDDVIEEMRDFGLDVVSLNLGGTPTDRKSVV
jgi:hypothetical protein